MSLIKHKSIRLLQTHLEVASGVVFLLKRLGSFFLWLSYYQT